MTAFPVVPTCWWPTSSAWLKCHFLHHIPTHIHPVSHLSFAQVWWTGRCWTRWSAGTGCPVPPSARTPCTSSCWPAGARSPKSGRPSSTSRASWKTTSPPLNHSTSRARTSRDPDPAKRASNERDIISPTRKWIQFMLWEFYGITQTILIHMGWQPSIQLSNSTC